LVTFIALLESTVLQTGQASLKLLAICLPLEVIIVADNLVATGFVGIGIGPVKAELGTGRVGCDLQSRDRTPEQKEGDKRKEKHHGGPL
jgi:hypothetical protein